MEKKGQNHFLNLLKAARLERPLIPLSFIMLSVGFANKITLAIFILMLCCVFMYSVGGLINAKVDKDFDLKHTNKTIFVLITISLMLSLYNYIIFFAVIASFFLAIFYNKVSRYFLFGDTIILSITHSTLPIVSAALILGLNSNLIISLAGFAIFPMSLIIHMKNLKGVEDDKKRNYKTLMTLFPKGKEITNIFFGFYFIILFSAYFIFNLGNKFLSVLLITFAVKMVVDHYMLTKKEVTAYSWSRLIMILFAFAFVFDQTSDIKLILLHTPLIFIYLIFLFSNTTEKLK